MNLSSYAPRVGAANRDALEARFGLRACARLSEASEALPHDVAERLRVARELAVSRASAKKRAAAPVATEAFNAVVNADGTLSQRFLGGDSGDSWWVRLSSLAPLLLLLAGLLLIHNWERHEQISAAADIDVALLGDTLPPEAYTDPGFDEFLKAPELAPAATSN